MDIQTIFYINIGLTVFLAIFLVIMAFVFSRQRKKYLDGEKANISKERNSASFSDESKEE